jgi:phytoene dehydrogenase-like protein
LTQREVDVLIVGAGLGGLAAALELAREGVKTLLVENRAEVGGRCQTINVDGYKLPAGTVVIPCGDFLEDLFNRVGVPFDVVPLDTRGVYEVEGELIAIPPKGALRILAEACAGKETADRLVRAIRRGLSWEEPSAVISMRDWLAQYTDSTSLLGAFQALAGAYMATNSYEVSARSFVQYLKAAARAGQIGIPTHGWGALVSPLGERYRELGGELSLQTRAESLIAGDGQVTGAKVRRGTDEFDVLAKVVISDVGPAATVALAGRPAWDSGYLSDVDGLRSSPGVALFFKHDEPLAFGAGPLLPSSAERACFVITPTVIVDTLAPAGRHWTEVLVTLEDSTKQSPKAAQAAVDVARQEIWSLFPQLNGLEPFKVMNFRSGWPIYRAWPGTDLSTRSAIVNLFSVGDAHKAPGLSGTSAAAHTGYTAARDALELLG